MFRYSFLNILKMNQDFLIVAIVFGILAVLLLIHHRIKHNADKRLSREEKWFQIDDVYNSHWAHEKFVFVFSLIAIGFGIAYGFS